MSSLYIKLKQYGNALDAYRESLRIREIVLASGTCFWDIYAGLFEIKQSPTASDITGTTSNIEILSEALDMKIALLGMDHIYVAFIFSHMAKIFEDQGMFSKATENYSQCLSIEKALFGNLHLSVAETNCDMAVTANLSGNLALALQLMNEALSIKAAIVGRDHADYKEMTYLKMNLINSLKPKTGGTVVTGKKRRAKRIYISVDNSFIQWTLARIKDCEEKLKAGYSFSASSTGSGAARSGDNEDKKDNCAIS